jgi:tetratricopeptide (TPR) repeat protein
MKKSSQPVKKTVSKSGASGKRKTPSKKAGGRPAQPEKSHDTNELDRLEQVRLFDKAVQLFHAGDLRQAKEMFQQVARGPAKEMAHSARVHELVCDRRLSRDVPELSTPEDHYNYAITLMNRHQLKEAEGHLRQAVAGKEDGDHFHYALALCCGLSGDLEAASRHLKRAIELHPRNRAAARNDPDFLPIAGQHPLREILYPERTSSG